MFQLILAAVDASPRADGVVSTAVELAERFDGTVHLFRAVSLPPDIPAAAANPPDDFSALMLELAERDVRRLATGRNRTVVEPTTLAMEPAWRAILREAERVGAQLIVIGSHGFGGWDRLLGTTAGKVVNHAQCPVLVVHERPPAPA